jgi:hypothetical protein
MSLRKLPPDRKVGDRGRRPKPDWHPLTEVPGVGPSIAENLWALGIRAVSDLKGRDPEELYRALCEYEGVLVDRCALYVFRCAVYYASEPVHDPERLKWWNWKDGRR